MVGHDAVDAEVEETIHLRGIVDRPHVDLEPEAMGGGHEAGRHERDALQAGRNLRGHPKAGWLRRAAVVVVQDAAETFATRNRRSRAAFSLVATAAVVISRLPSPW